MVEYKVINWDFNTDRIEHYDIMPYLYARLEEKRKRRHISLKDLTFERLKEFIDNESKYQFWSRCQYEVIVTGWPVQKHEHKLDVYEQIKMNLDNITKLMFDDLQKGKPARVIKGRGTVEIKPVKYPQCGNKGDSTSSRMGS